VVVSADDPGMASSQNEQDNRRYALAAGVPMLEPSDSQEAYEFTLRAIEISERWQVPVLLRMTTRVCHSKTIVRRGTVRFPRRAGALRARFPLPRDDSRLRRRRICGCAKAGADCRLERRVGPNQFIAGSSFAGNHHLGRGLPACARSRARGQRAEAGNDLSAARRAMRAFAASVERCVVIEEGDPYLVEAARTAGIAVEASRRASASAS
jgi:indolepyruvate ferredoxin oxidoreductase alpha subunit